MRGPFHWVSKYADRVDKDQRWSIFFVLSIGAGLVLRAYLVVMTATPGTSDPAFYYTVARSLAEGRGLTIDYVAFYFNGLVPVTHYSNDYWLPLASILLSLPMFLFGKTVASALLASVLAGIVPCLVGYAAALYFHQSKPIAVLTGVLTFFSPIQITSSVVTDTIIFFGAFGSVALYLSSLGRQSDRYFLIAAVCTGLAHLIRQDGVLLLAVVMLMVILSRRPAGRKALLLAGIAGIHLIVISPLLLRNYAETGSVLSAGLSKTLFLTKYEDMYTYGKSSSWQTYRAELGIRKIVSAKLRTAGFNLVQFTNFLDPVLSLLALMGLASWIRSKRWSEAGFLLPALIFASLGYIFYSFVWSIHGPGSFYKGLAVLMPFISLMIIGFLRQQIRSLRILTLAVVILAVYSGSQGFRLARRFSAYYNTIYHYYDQVKNAVAADSAGRNLPAESIIIMSREPWDINAATGLKSVMIPENDLDTIFRVAQHYRAGYILLPAPRKALDEIYSGQAADSRFTYLASIQDTGWKIFRIELSP